MAGRNTKNSIGTTNFATVPICITGFLMYMLTESISDWNLIIYLSIGAALASPLGAKFTSSFRSEQKIKSFLGILLMIVGILVLIKTWII